MTEILIGISKYLQCILLSFTLGFYIINKYISCNLKRIHDAKNKVNLALILISLVSILILYIQIYYRYEDFGKVFDYYALKNIILNTRFGLIWLIKFLLLGILFALINKTKFYNAIIIILLVILGSSSLTGHAISANISYIAIPSNFIHIISLSAWFGCLPFLFFNLFKFNKKEIDKKPLIKFSKFSGYNISIIILSGIILALINLDYSFPALIGTNYGQIIIIKIIFILLALCCALYLRMHFINNKKKFILNFNAYKILLLEIIFSLFIFTIGIALSQIIPGAHEEIKWPMNFRISVDVALENSFNVKSIFIIAIIISIIIGVAFMDYLLNRNVKRFILGYVPLVGILLITSAYILSIEAYPVTYKQASIPYSAISISNGKNLYRKNCIDCHGYSGHGDGILVNNELEILPANLTEPHTAYHTAGDIYWWLTNGMPPSIMPSFKDVLSEDDRWDIINFLRTLSSGYEARIISDKIVNKKPWLPAIDFDFVTNKGNYGRLSQFRKNKFVILIILNDLEQNYIRINNFINLYGDIKAVKGEIILIPDQNLIKSNTFKKLVQDIPFIVVYDGSQEIIDTYNLYRRTIDNLDKNDENENTEYLEFLIDKYGYIRSKWKKNETNNIKQVSDYLLTIKKLEKEGKILNIPDEHVH